MTVLVIAFFALTFVSWWLVGALMWTMRWHVGITAKASWGPMDLWLGSTERIVAASSAGGSRSSSPRTGRG
jgi:hypothetical protein